MTLPTAEILQNYVGGKWTPSQAREFVNVHNPAVGSVIAKTPLSTRADLDAAVQAAAKAFPAWRDTPVVQRARTLFKFVNLLEQHYDEIARTVTTSTARPSTRRAGASGAESSASKSRAARPR